MPKSSQTGWFTTSHGHTSSRGGNGNYNKQNCYWATARQQGRNRCDNLVLTFHGMSLPACEWAERFYLPRAVVYARIKSGWAVDRILLTPVDSRFSHRRKQDAICK